MTKAELIELLRAEHQSLNDAIASLSADELRAPRLDGGWSIKDTIAHVTTWERRIVRATTAADRGEEVEWPEPGFQMHEVDRLNERDFQAQRDRSLQDVLQDALVTLADYVAWIESYTEDEVPRERPYTPGITLEAIIRGNGDEHVREHVVAIKRSLEGAGG